MFFENPVNPPIPSDHAAVRIVIQKPSSQGQQCKRIPSWISKHPVFCSILKRLHETATDTLPAHLARSQMSKLSLNRLKGRLFASPHARRLTAWEQSYWSLPLHYVLKEKDILGLSCETSTKISCGMFRESSWRHPLDHWSNWVWWTHCLEEGFCTWPWRNSVLFGVRGDWAPSSFSTLTNICWKEVLFLNTLPKVGQSLFPRPLTSMTMENYLITRRTSSIVDVQLQLQLSHFCYLSRPSMVHYAMHWPFTEMHLHQADDRQHFWDRDHGLGSCCVLSAGSRHPIDGLCCCLSQRQSYLDPLCDSEDWTTWFHQPFPAKYLQRQHHTRGIRGNNPGTHPDGQGCKTGLSSEWFSSCNGLRPYLQMPPRGSYPNEPWRHGLLAASPMCLRRQRNNLEEVRRVVVVKQRNQPQRNKTSWFSSAPRCTQNQQSSTV